MDKRHPLGQGHATGEDSCRVDVQEEVSDKLVTVVHM
jgi:hypothetical protein